MIRTLARRVAALEAREAPKQWWYTVEELLPDVLAALGRSSELPRWLEAIGTDPAWDGMRAILDADPGLAEAIAAEAGRRTGMYLMPSDWNL